MAEPFARERVIASKFADKCPLPPGKIEELACLLSAYREELRALWEVDAKRRERRGL